MTVADAARAAALQLEVRKDGLAQRQDGRWQLKVIIHANDMPAALSLAPMGTRFMCVLVEIGDDELPINREEVVPDTRTEPEPQHKTGAGEKRHWSDLPPAQQAALRCKEPAFWTFLRSVWDSSCDNEESAKAYVRFACGDLKSRGELNTNPVAAAKWHEMDVHYLAWERIGAPPSVTPEPAEETV